MKPLVALCLVLMTALSLNCAAVMMAGVHPSDLKPMYALWLSENDFLTREFSGPEAVVCPECFRKGEHSRYKWVARLVPGAVGSGLLWMGRKSVPLPNVGKCVCDVMECDHGHRFVLVSVDR